MWSLCYGTDGRLDGLGAGQGEVRDAAVPTVDDALIPTVDDSDATAQSDVTVHSDATARSNTTVERT